MTARKRGLKPKGRPFPFHSWDSNRKFTLAFKRSILAEESNTKLQGRSTFIKIRSRE